MNGETNGSGKRLVVLAIVERPDRAGEKHTRWVKIGVGWANRDGSINLYLDALPVGTNKLQVRDDDRPSAQPPRNDGAEHLEARQ